MANMDIHDHRTGVSLRPINWSAAIWASIIAGVVFAVLEVALVALFQHQSPWAPLHMIGAIALGPPAMESPDTFAPGVIATAVIVHVLLAMFYGVILEFIVSRPERRLSSARFTAWRCISSISTALPSGFCGLPTRATGSAYLPTLCRAG